MARLPFDPSRVAVPADERAAATPSGPLTVSQLTARIKRTLADHLPATVHVVGEISNCKHHTSGHIYLTLKDGDAELPCVMWRSDAARLKFRPADGLEVVATGRIEVWERGGRYQLYFRRLEPRGVGALELAFRQLCETLRAEGLFDEARKQPLPAYPRCLAVVTSPTGAAVRDILETLRRRFPCARVLIHPVPVQGEGAAAQIAAAIGRLGQQAERLGGIDLMLVSRGGGSIEDLWAFNEEPVARAIAASRIPIITGIGHEVDTTVADLVADVRAHTPTAAAERAVPVLADLLAGLDTAAARLRRGAAARLELARTRFDALAGHELFRRPVDRLRRIEQQLDERQTRLALSIARLIERLRRRVHAAELALAGIQPARYHAGLADRLTRLGHRLERAGRARCTRAERRLATLAEQLAHGTPARHVDAGLARLEQLRMRLRAAVRHRQTLAAQQTDALACRLESTSHKSVLTRGYSITRESRRGRIITDSDQVKPGDKVRTETGSGAFESEVIDANQPTLF